MIRVLIADDHGMMREGLRRLLADAGDMLVAGEAATGEDTLAALALAPVDVVLLDVSMPHTSFTDTLRELRARYPTVRVVVLSGHAEEEYAVRAFKAGAVAYLTKERSPEELVAAIRAAAAGRRSIAPSIAQLLAAEAADEAGRPAHGRLSDRELEVLRHLGAGRSIKEVGAELGLSAKTVSTYRARLLEKLGLTSTAEIIRYAIEHKLV